MEDVKRITCLTQHQHKLPAKEFGGLRSCRTKNQRAEGNGLNRWREAPRGQPRTQAEEGQCESDPQGKEVRPPPPSRRATGVEEPAAQRHPEEKLGQVQQGKVEGHVGAEHARVPTAGDGFPSNGNSQ